jgi:hypothetical protein
MTEAPTLKLRPLDERVLAALPEPTAAGVRARHVAAAVYARVTGAEVREAREILRGLEAVGLAYQAGGWWRRPGRSAGTS